MSELTNKLVFDKIFRLAQTRLSERRPYPKIGIIASLQRPDCIFEIKTSLSGSGDRIIDVLYRKKQDPTPDEVIEVFSTTMLVNGLPQEEIRNIRLSAEFLDLPQIREKVKSQTSNF